MTTPRITRRQTLAGAAVVGVGAPLLAACGDGGGSATDPAASPGSSTSESATPSASPTEPDTSEPDTSEPAEPPADTLTTTAEVPEGGGTILAGEKVVVTQPAAGEFKCFTAVCTHQGCIVSGVADGTINCRCHGSSFSIADGSVVGGPAPSGLAEVPISVQGRAIRLS